MAIQAAVPVVVGGARMLPILARARTLIQGVFSSAPAAVAAASRRTGITGGAQRILGAIRNNKVLTALVLMDLGTEGAELLAEMAANDQEIAEMVSRYGVVNDPVKEDTSANLAEQADEMQVITNAANSVGGLQALHNLRRALSLSEDHYKLYDNLKILSRTVR